MIFYIIITLFNFLMYIFFFTPKFITNNIFSLFGYNKFIYIDKNSKTKELLSYIFNHKFYDGKLMSYNIQQELVNYKIENDAILFKPLFYNFIIKEYSKELVNYSKFNIVLSHLLYKMLLHQKRKINICIIVSIRDKLINKMKKGNYIKYACFSVNLSDNIFSIANKYKNSVKEIQNKNYFVKNTTIYDLISSFRNIDYIFNNWRDLSQIKTINNKYLIRQLDNNVTKENIEDLINNKKKAFIIFDFLENNYIISSIKNI